MEREGRASPLRALWLLLLFLIALESWIPPLSPAEAGDRSFPSAATGAPDTSWSSPDQELARSLCLKRLRDLTLLISSHSLYHPSPQTLLDGALASLRRAFPSYRIPPLDRGDDPWQGFRERFVLLSGRVPLKDLTHYSIRGMVRAIPGDLYASLLPPLPSGVVAAQGVGIEVIPRDRLLVIGGVIPGSPAEKKGIREGDRIVRVGNLEVRNDPREALEALDKVYPFLSLRLQNSEGGMLDLAIVPAPITLGSVTYRRIGNLGYISVPVLSPGADERVEEGLRLFTSLGVRGVLLDLRNNPGGDPRKGARVAGMFLSRGKVLYYKEEGGRKLPYLNAVSFQWEGPLAIAVNGGTASAAELMTAAIKDYKRGLVIGRSTAGKALIQSTFNLGSGWEIKFTTGRYLTPGGEDLQGKGISPHYTVPLGQKDELAAILRLFEQQLR